MQPITKHHVLLLSFAITTQKPTEICQVSCKNQSHLSMCKQWHKHLSACKQWHKQSSTCKRWHRRSSTCKRWHRRTNQVVTCVTNRTSPCVAHPLPNSYKYRSLPKAFENRTEDSEIQKLYKNQASKPSRTSIPKLKNTRSKIIQTICLDPRVYENQAQRSEKHQQTTNRWSSTNSSL